MKPKLKFKKKPTPIATATTKPKRLSPTAKLRLMHDDYVRITQEDIAKREAENQHLTAEREAAIKARTEAEGNLGFMKMLRDGYDRGTERERAKRDHAIEFEIGPMKLKWSGPINQAEIISAATPYGCQPLTGEMHITPERLRELINNEVASQIEAAKHTKQS